MDSKPKNRGGLHGFTLVEMLVVVVIVSIMSVAIVAEMHGTFQDALLRATSRALAGACNVASSRAISVNRPYRVRIDRFEHRYVLESSSRGGSLFSPAKDIPGGSGTLDAHITIHILEPGMNIPDDAGTEPPDNSGNAGNFSSVPLEEAVTFYPDGTADDRMMELVDRDGFRLGLRVNPITSRVQIKKIERQ
jgi:prepilin-type N-terminal cleavage/methylation domain-containing protein